MDASSWEHLLKEIRQQRWYRNQIKHVEVLRRREAQYAEPSSPIHPSVTEALKQIGIEKLYRHQAHAIDAINMGKHVLIATTTASGKTLCYNIPVLSKLLSNRNATALYIFPTKALAQDQLRKLYELKLGFLISAQTYDGDTPLSHRRHIRENCRLVFTNPDMLHCAVLPNHYLWRKFISNLKFVVLDELHVYSGIFGMHMASIIRRLKRLCELYGSEPQFICTSATIGNPHEFSRNLLGVECTVISDDTAPFPGKTFVLWEPPLLPSGVRVRASVEAVRLLIFMMERGIRTIVFVQSRATAELLLRHVREELAKHNPSLCGKVISYRAGYLPHERRAIERKLFDGELMAVIATTALELGIDIGHLSAAIILGYPGSIASTMQQAGRAGRIEEGIAFFVATGNPVDQYIVNHPEYLFSKGAEDVLISATNPYILASHLLCAAYEHPLSESDSRHFGAKGYALLEILLERERHLQKAEGVIEGRRSFWYLWAGKERPHDSISIRSITGSNYEIRDVTKGYSLIGIVDEVRAFTTIYEGAIYLHAGDAYRIISLDIRNRVALAVPFDGDEYTVTLEQADVSIVKHLKERRRELMRAYLGEVTISQRVLGYKRLKMHTEQVLEVRRLDLPETKYETVALWITLDGRLLAELNERGFDLAGSLHAAEHALIAIMPLVTPCDRRDIGGVSYLHNAQTRQATIFIYDGYPGGAGFSETAFDQLEEFITRTAEMIKSCQCRDGCPSCVQSPSCGNNNQPLDKRGAVALLEGLLGLKALKGKRYHVSDARRQVFDG
jgi:DEAD/DEAH box helicase domain-containing protein